MSLWIILDEAMRSPYFLGRIERRGSDIVKAAGSSRPAASKRAPSMLGGECLNGQNQMERKYESVPGFYCWNLEKCEEEIVIAALLEISGLIPPAQKWQRTLEEYFFDRGKGLADDALIEINQARKHHGLAPIQVRETAVGDYTLSRDELLKSQRRRQIRKELSEADTKVRAERLAQAKAEEERLPLPHYTYEEFKSRKLQQNASRPLGQGDIPRRPSTWGDGGAPAVISIGTRLPRDRRSTPIFNVSSRTEWRKFGKQFTD